MIGAVRSRQVGQDRVGVDPAGNAILLADNSDAAEGGAAIMAPQAIAKTRVVRLEFVGRLPVESGFIGDRQDFVPL